MSRYVITEADQRWEVTRDRWAVGITIALLVWSYGLIGWVAGIAAVLVVVAAFGVLMHRVTVEFEERTAEADRLYRDICDRADRQHNLRMQGDPRGTYGEWES